VGKNLHFFIAQGSFFPMNHSDDIFEKVVAGLESGVERQKELERAVGMTRKTLAR
jgi:hypothetical protein